MESKMSGTRLAEITDTFLGLNGRVRKAAIAEEFGKFYDAPSVARLIQMLIFRGMKFRE